MLSYSTLIQNLESGVVEDHLKVGTTDTSARVLSHRSVKCVLTEHHKNTCQQLISSLTRSHLLKDNCGNFPFALIISCFMIRMKQSTEVTFRSNKVSWLIA